MLEQPRRLALNLATLILMILKLLKEHNGNPFCMAL